MPRRVRLAILAALAAIAIASFAVGLRPVRPTAVAGPPPKDFKPKVWDYPGHNFW